MECFRRKRLFRQILVAFLICYVAWLAVTTFWMLPIYAAQRPNTVAHLRGNSNIFLPKGVDQYPMFIDGSFVPANRIFHLDLKGAPPRMKYWEELIPFIRAIGATGILLEYEDMFPYSGRLGRLKSANAYTEGELLRILTLARSNNLEIIPLVQTLGHLEWILKYKEFAKYRESEQYPQVICLGDDEAVNLVLEALAQVTRVHKDIGINFFHIGGDEVFQIGMCESDKKVMEEMGWGHDQLLVHHFMRIAKYVKANVEGVRIVMWHDMLVGVSQELIKQIGLNLLVEPVVWQYAEDLDQSLNNDLWPSLAINFHYIWAASAFKGADGPSQYILNLPHYLKNHVSWMKQMNDVYEQFLQFRGVFVTGWQRFDHFAVLCELLPVSLVSAAFNFAVLKNGPSNDIVVREAERVLKCKLAPMDVFGSEDRDFEHCFFPGRGVYAAINHLHRNLRSVEEKVFKDYRVLGWLSDFNDRYEYTQVWYLSEVRRKVLDYMHFLRRATGFVKEAMIPIFFEDTIQEFVIQYINPTMDRLQKLLERIEKLSKLRDFPRLTFQTTDDLRRQS